MYWDHPISQKTAVSQMCIKIILATNAYEHFKSDKLSQHVGLEFHLAQSCIVSVLKPTESFTDL